MFPDKVYVHCDCCVKMAFLSAYHRSIIDLLGSERNTVMLTLDGVDVMGERLAEEIHSVVLEVIKTRPGLKIISFVAHSVGGLVARFAIGKLYRPSKGGSIEQVSTNECIEESKGLIADLEPVNFITVATPHLGSRGNKQANMSPEYGATTGFFPVDRVTLQYLKLTGRSNETVAMIECYLRANRMFVDYNEPQQERVYSSYLELDLANVEPCNSGPKRIVTGFPPTLRDLLCRRRHKKRW